MCKLLILRLKKIGVNHVLKERMGGLNKSFRKYAERTGGGDSKKVDFLFRNHYQQNVAEMWHSEAGNKDFERIGKIGRSLTESLFFEFKTAGMSTKKWSALAACVAAALYW